MLRRLIAFILTLGFSLSVFSQEAWDIAKTKIAGKSISIEYGRPNLKGRNLSDLMKQLPADRIWRAGSGPITVLSMEADFLIGSKKVPAGTYSLYMCCPEKGDFALVINRDLGVDPDVVLAKATPDRSNRPYPHFMDYTSGIADKEVARIPVNKIPGTKTQILIYQFEPSDNGALLKITWGDQGWTVDFQPVAAP